MKLNIRVASCHWPSKEPIRWWLRRFQWNVGVLAPPEMTLWVSELSNFVSKQLTRGKHPSKGDDAPTDEAQSYPKGISWVSQCQKTFDGAIFDLVLMCEGCKVGAKMARSMKVRWMTSEQISAITASTFSRLSFLHVEFVDSLAKRGCQIVDP